MKVVKVKDYEELSKNLGEEVLSYIRSKERKIICLPSGDTPVGAYQYIVKQLDDEDLNSYKSIFVGLDEWANMSREDEGSCQYYMYKYLFGPLGLDSDKIVEFNAKAEDLTNECLKMDKFLKEYGPLDLVVLGIGMNGHLGLNEPGTSFNEYSHVVKLDETTVKIAQKYFTTTKVLDKGITLGLKHFLEAKKMILIASGSKKADIVKRIVEGEIDEEIPATIARLHRNSYLIVDEESAKGLESIGRNNE
ncbi:glucosamine-6-phosphate deaminase [Fonticella tunisiensis]|uniref:Glucosamine-6-phosphate deaminase n=1 Tax=Fonticella tunisiensis TaxID=1096341 RepID=A0A4R7KKY6_9CLOT|nr:glucosamine-6-phosphate deaminase [Fonticella tunisiensis]TDT56511.1 glucosamine-6-phosphate deaminase [Fonticella tunisiensis]